MTGDPPIGLTQSADSHGDSSDLDQLDLASLVERGYTRAYFGDELVLVTPELAAQIRAFREKTL